MIENIGQFMEFLDEFLELPGWLTGAGQVWVINSNFYLQLNLCVCYRENQFGLIVGPGRALLTLARSHICPVNKFVRKKSS